MKDFLTVFFTRWETGMLCGMIAGMIIVAKVTGYGPLAILQAFLSLFRI